MVILLGSSADQEKRVSSVCARSAGGLEGLTVYSDIVDCHAKTRGKEVSTGAEPYNN